MTNSKNTKKSLYASALALLLCFVMLIGTTFAWFTDSASTGVNTITAGNLKIGMYYADGKEVPADANWLNAKAATDIFGNGLWEPGYTVARHIKIANEGNLALKYKVDFAVENPGTLAEVIDVYFVDPAEKIENRAALSDLTPVGTLAKVLAGGVDLNGSLAALKSDTFTIVLKMQESAGNAYKNATVGDLTIHLRATQDTAESDSFGKDYDANAEMDLLPTERRATNDSELATILTNLEGVDTIYLGKGQFAAINMEGKSVDIVGSVDETGAPATVIKATAAPNLKGDAGNWNGYKGTVKNIVFTADNGVANTGTYGALALRHGDVRMRCDAAFENCKFDNQGITYAGKVSFKNCTFDGKDHVARAFNYCIPNSDITLEGCTISGYTQDSFHAGECEANVNVTFKNCNISGAPMEFGNVAKVIIEGGKIDCTVNIYLTSTAVEVSGVTQGTNYNLVKH